METLAIIDFGSQYTHLIARATRQLGVHSKIYPPSAPLESLVSCKGLILSGSPFSVGGAGAPDINWDLDAFPGRILGICYGHQLLCSKLVGGPRRVSNNVTNSTCEFGSALLRICQSSRLFQGIPKTSTVWMSHRDSVGRLPATFRQIASSAQHTAAVESTNGKFFGLQFHPEVAHSEYGSQILQNFLQICGYSFNWSMETYLTRLEIQIRQAAGSRNVFMLLSGGVDSTVAFCLLNKLLGPQRAYALHIDNGFMRKNESQWVQETFKKLGYTNFKVVDASTTFYERLAGVTDPEKKRKIIGNTFLDVQEAALKDMELDPAKWLLGQGTIYPDTIESGCGHAADTIKTHHNRVDRVRQLMDRGLVIEPLSELYKDEVRGLGELLGLPHELVWRHPFPGPGLAIRILCTQESLDTQAQIVLKGARAESAPACFIAPLRSVGVQGDSRSYAHPAILEGPFSNWEQLSGMSVNITNSYSKINRVLWKVAGPEIAGHSVFAAGLVPKRIEKLRDLDDLVTTFLRESGYYAQIWQMPVVLIPYGVGAQDSVVLRPVESQEAMTANFARLSIDSLESLATKLLSTGLVSSVFYDITNKPPATIEWE